MTDNQRNAYRRSVPLAEYRKRLSEKMIDIEEWMLPRASELHDLREYLRHKYNSRWEYAHQN